MRKTDIHIDYNLLIKLREGNEKAFSIVFDTYYKYLYVLAYRYLMSETQAEDAVQHTFMRLWEARETFDYKKGIKNLLFTILKNYLLNEIRHNNLVVQKNYELAQQIGESEMSFDDYEKEDFKTHIYNLINKLPPQKREVCLLKIETDMTNQEIADHMNISLSTVKSHFTQLVKILRTKIEIIIIFGLYLTNFF
jgi:RNA polymerase sigma-70 factor (ECF subfamily)